jgi:hypothetical protein
MQCSPGVGHARINCRNIREQRIVGAPVLVAVNGGPVIESTERFSIGKRRYRTLRRDLLWQRRMQAKSNVDSRLWLFGQVSLAAYTIVHFLIQVKPPINAKSNDCVSLFSRWTAVSDPQVLR